MSNPFLKPAGPGTILDSLPKHRENSTVPLSQKINLENFGVDLQHSGGFQFKKKLAFENIFPSRQETLEQLDKERKKVQLQNQHLISLLRSSNLNILERTKSAGWRDLHEKELARLRQGFDFYNFDQRRDDIFGALGKHVWGQTIQAIKKMVNTDSEIAYYLLVQTGMAINILTKFPEDFSSQQPELRLTESQFLREVAKFLVRDKIHLVSLYHMLLIKLRTLEMWLIDNKTLIKILESLIKNCQGDRQLEEKAIALLVGCWDKSSLGERNQILTGIFNQFSKSLQNKDLNDKLMNPLFSSMLAEEIEGPFQLSGVFIGLSHYYLEQKNDRKLLLAAIQHFQGLDCIREEWYDPILSQVEKRTPRHMRMERSPFQHTVIEIVFVLETFSKMTEIPKNKIGIISIFMIQALVIAPFLNCYYLNRLNLEYLPNLSTACFIFIKMKAHTSSKEFAQQCKGVITAYAEIRPEFSSVCYLSEIICLWGRIIESYYYIPTIQRKLRPRSQMNNGTSQAITFIAKLFRFCPQDWAAKNKVYSLLQVYIKMIVSQGYTEQYLISESLVKVGEIVLANSAPSNIKRFLDFISLASKLGKLKAQDTIIHFEKGLQLIASKSPSVLKDKNIHKLPEDEEEAISDIELSTIKTALECFESDSATDQVLQCCTIVDLLWELLLKNFLAISLQSQMLALQKYFQGDCAKLLRRRQNQLQEDYKQRRLVFVLFVIVLSQKWQQAHPGIIGEARISEQIVLWLQVCKQVYLSTILQTTRQDIHFVKEFLFFLNLNQGRITLRFYDNGMSELKNALLDVYSSRNEEVVVILLFIEQHLNGSPGIVKNLKEPMELGLFWLNSINVDSKREFQKVSDYFISCLVRYPNPKLSTKISFGGLVKKFIFFLESNRFDLSFIPYQPKNVFTFDRQLWNMALFRYLIARTTYSTQNKAQQAQSLLGNIYQTGIFNIKDLPFQTISQIPKLIGMFSLVNTMFKQKWFTLKEKECLWLRKAMEIACTATTHCLGNMSQPKTNLQHQLSENEFVAREDYDYSRRFPSLSNDFFLVELRYKITLLSQYLTFKKLTANEIVPLKPDGAIVLFELCQFTWANFLEKDSAVSFRRLSKAVEQFRNGPKSQDQVQINQLCQQILKEEDLVEELFGILEDVGQIHLQQQQGISNSFRSLLQKIVARRNCSKTEIVF